MPCSLPFFLCFVAVQRHRRLIPFPLNRCIDISFLPTYLLSILQSTHHAHTHTHTHTSLHDAQVLNSLTLSLPLSLCHSSCLSGSGSGYFSCLVACLLGERGLSHGIDVNSDTVQHSEACCQRWYDSIILRRGQGEENLPTISRCVILAINNTPILPLDERVHFNILIFAQKYAHPRTRTHSCYPLPHSTSCIVS